MTMNLLDPFAHLHDENYQTHFAQPVINYKHLIFQEGREVQSLDGDWLCTLDPFDEGLRQRWFADDHQSPDKWHTPRDYQVEAGKRVKVPGCINLYDEQWTHYEGVVWFTKDFEYIYQSDERVFLRIGAAAYQARIFLNGEFLGVHLGASTPFCVELKHLKNGLNRLQIQVDNIRSPKRVPMHHIDWFNYGGLYREVSLLKVPPVFIADFGIALMPDTQFSRLRVDIELSNNEKGFATIEIPELSIKAEIPIKAGRGIIEIEAKPELWSPSSPRLYSVFVHYGTDSIHDRVGFREIRVEGETIFLNGAPLWLRGICVHEEYPDTGKTATESDVRAMLADARALGSNFLRLSHYPHHECVAKLADELGFLLWEEIPVYWAIDFESSATFEDADNQLRELIRRDRNRASVIVWGVGNENADSDARYSFMSRLVETARTMDGTRLVSAACLINREKFRIEDRLAAHLDIVGINEYFGWYEPDFQGLTRLLENSNPKKPVVITETGADAQAGLRGDKRQLFTEDCQAEIYRQQIAILEKFSYIQGICPWVLYDFRSERRQTSFQKGYNRKGLIAEDHQTRKQAFKILADFYFGKHVL